MNQYINIHTHHLSADNGVFVFNNRFGYDKKLYTDSLFSVGIHPWDTELAQAVLFEELEKIIAHPSCFAIGECGLDKLRGPDIALQKQVFEQQLQLAQKYHKPVIIHCVKAFNELQEICKSYINRIPLIIHGFNKSSQLAVDLIEKGFYLSASLPLFKKENFDFGAISSEKLLLETDMLEDVSIQEVYDLAASKFNMSRDELKEKISLNFGRLNKYI